MKELFKHKYFYIWPLTILAILFFVRKNLNAVVPYEEVPSWIRFALYALIEVLVLGILILCVLLEKHKKFRLGFIISILVLGIDRYQSDVFWLLFSLIAIVALITIRFFLKQTRAKPDFLLYFLTLFLCLVYFLFKLNIGDKIVIDILYVSSIIGFVSLMLLYILYFLPKAESIKREITFKKISPRDSLTIVTVFVVSFVISGLFNLFIKDEIIDYKYKRFKNIQIDNYYNKQADFQFVVENLSELSNIPYLEFINDKISIIIQDTTISDSLRNPTQSSLNTNTALTEISYDLRYGYSSVDLLKDNTISISYYNPDTTVIIKQNWSLNATYINKNDTIIAKMLDYLDITPLELEEIKNDLSLIDCIGFEKDTYGNIYRY